MKLKKLIKGCVLSLLMGSLLTMNVSAMDSYVIYFTGYRQKTFSWCWVASAETSAKYMTSSKHDQYSTVRYLKGTNTNPYPEVSGDIYDIANAANYISYNKFSYKGYNSIRTEFFLIGQLNSNKMPIAGASRYKNGVKNGGHATPICGMFVFNDGTIYIGYYDPLNDSVLSCKFQEFCDGSYNGRKYDSTCYI